MCDAWQRHQLTKELDIRSNLGASYCLRQRMLHFQQNFGYYMMVEVIAPRWIQLTRAIECAGTIDQVLEHHRDFLDNCLKECLLAEPTLLPVLTKIMHVCLYFAQTLEAFTQPYEQDEDTIKSERTEARERRQARENQAEVEAQVAKVLGKQGMKKSNLMKPNLKRRASSNGDVRRLRIQELSKDVNAALSDENPFVQITNELEVQFDALLQEFLTKLLDQSRKQVRVYISCCEYYL